MRILILLALVLSFTTSYAYEYLGNNSAALVLKSSSFSNSQPIPSLNSCDGKGVWPELSWDNVPANTQSFVLIMSSPDALIDAMHYLWVLYDIPKEVNHIAPNVLPEGAKVGTNGLGDNLYAPPCPLDGGVKHYVFTLYAIDLPNLVLTQSTTAEFVLAKIKGHVLQQTTVIGTYSH